MCMSAIVNVRLLVNVYVCHCVVPLLVNMHVSPRVVVCLHVLETSLYRGGAVKNFIDNTMLLFSNRRSFDSIVAATGSLTPM